MKVSAVLTLVGSRWLAQCEEVDLAGEGATPGEAVDALRRALEEYFASPEAVAPPPEKPREPIEVIVVAG